MNTSHCRFTLAAALALAAIQPVRAQESKSLPAVEVVGSRIKRADYEPPVPVTIIRREEIRASGATSVGELLNAHSLANGAAVYDTDFASGFSAGAATVSLRGLGSQATLVLVNGRRIVPLPAADPNVGQSVLYNVNFIPLSAIERIEILPSGASALYGSDAVAGVVNIVLRDNLQGGKAGIRHSANGQGHFGNRQIHGLVGFGKMAEDGFNASITFENTRREATSVGETRGVQNSELARLFNRNTTGSTTNAYPGNYFIEETPGSGAFTQFFARDARCPPDAVRPNGMCGYNLHAPLTTEDARESNSLYGRVDFRVNPSLSLFSEFGLSRIEYKFLFPARFVSEAGSVWFSESGQSNVFKFILPAGHPDNPASVPVALRYRFADLGPIRRATTIDANRLLVGAKGRGGPWEWESALLYMRSTTESTDRGMLHFASITNAIANGTYRPFGNNSPAVLAAISPLSTQSGESTHTVWDLKASRELAELSGGPLALTAGMEARRETLSVVPDPRMSAGEFVGFGATSASGRRNVTSLFAEMSAPFLKQVETQLALRHDRYSDFGNATTPQLAVKWKPADSLALRAGYAKGFRAPSLANISNSNVTAFVPGLTDPLRCDKPGGTEDDCFFSGASMIRANPALKPEKSDSQMLGFVFSPVSNADVAMNVYRIDRRNEVGVLDTQFIIDNEATLPGTVMRDPNPASWLPGVPNSGPIQTTTRQFLNLGRTISRGLDFEANLRNSLGVWGSLRTELAGTYLLSYKYRKREGDPYFSGEGRVGPGGELPRMKASLTSTWKYSDYALTGRVNYVSGWEYGDQESGCFSGNGTYIADYRCRVKAWTTLDMQLAYTGVKNLELGVGVRNLTDKAAPLDPTSYYMTLGYNPGFHNPYGRYYSAWLNYKF